MSIEIISNRTKEIEGKDLISKAGGLLRSLPKTMALEIDMIEKSGKKIEEIRLRGRSVSSVTVSKQNIILKNSATEADIQNMLLTVCGGSPYAYAETIKKGYVTVEGGIRIGICGRAVTEGNRIIGIRDVSGLNIRIPTDSVRVGGRVAQIIKEQCLNGGGGVLIYSPPGEGKTTLLKGTVSYLASGSEALRVVVVDTRDELLMIPSKKDLCVDVLSGYPKAVGIEIATRTMNAQLIVCDEIGTSEDVEVILFAQNCGVPLLASAHASGLEGLLKRTGIAKLHKSRAFDFYIGIKRATEGGDYEYTVNSWEEADKLYGN